MRLPVIDKSWTLFLDRDGVINKELPGDYVKTIDEMIFLPGVPEAISKASKLFGRIFIITNQRGVGRGLMTEEQLNIVHQYLISEITKHSGHIDKIYYCTDVNDDSPNRKPNVGMAIQAKKEFPEVDLGRTIMAGNHLSDMQFGRNTGSYTAFIATTNPETPFPHPLIDAKFNDLPSLINALQST